MEELMQFGLDVPTTGAYADARVQAQLALEAEAAGWDGFFLWDTLLGAEAIIDPWIALTAIALHTLAYQDWSARPSPSPPSPLARGGATRQSRSAFRWPGDLHGRIGIR